MRSAPKMMPGKRSCPLDTTVTLAEDRETGKTATKILGGRLASSQLNQVQDRVEQRPCNYCGKKGHGSGSLLERKYKCKAFGKACSNCNNLHHMAKMCFKRPTNIVVVISDEEDVMKNNMKCEVFTTLDEIGVTEITADETADKENKVLVDLDKIIIKRRIKEDKHDQGKLLETITEVLAANDSPARPKSSVKLTPRYGPDDYSPKEDSLDDYKPSNYGPDDYSPIDYKLIDSSPSNYSPDDSDNKGMKRKPRTSTRRRRARARGLT
jgi:hypothetical protein